MKKKMFNPCGMVVVFILWIGFTSCDVLENITPKTESQKRTELLTTGGIWTVDSLILRTDTYNGSVSTVTSETIHLNYGTLEFQSSENATNPGYNTGYAIHRYTEGSVNKVDTMAWAPYNFNSGSDNHITIFYSNPNEDFVVNAYDMYFDLLTFEKKLVRIESWRREAILGGGGTSSGNFKRYHLTR